MDPQRWECISVGAFERIPASIPPSIPLPLTAEIPGQSMQTDDFFCVYFSQNLTQIFLLQGLADVFNACAFCYSVQKDTHTLSETFFCR